MREAAHWYLSETAALNARAIVVLQYKVKWQKNTQQKINGGLGVASEPHREILVVDQSQTGLASHCL
jgi:hypothetical protein